MTKVKIDPGACGFISSVTAQTVEDEDEMLVKINIKSGCPSVQGITKDLGDTFDAYDECLKKPGDNSFYKYAMTNFPGHASCPILSGITKAIEIEANLALPHDVYIKFEE